MPERALYIYPMQKIEHILYSRFTILLLLYSILILLAFPFIQVSYIQNDRTYIQEVSGYRCALGYIINHQKIAINIPIIICLSAVITCVLMYVINTKEEGYGFLLGLCGIISLVIFQITINYLFEYDDNTYKINYTAYYWVCQLILATVSSISYLNHNKKNKQGKILKNELHINIITQKGDE